MAAGRMIQIPRSFSPDGVIYSTAVRSLQDLRDNDEAAAAEAEAQKGVPGYCGACPCIALKFLVLVQGRPCICINMMGWGQIRHVLGKGLKSYRDGLC